MVIVEWEATKDLVLPRVHQLGFHVGKHVANLIQMKLVALVKHGLPARPVLPPNLWQAHGFKGDRRGTMLQ